MGSVESQLATGVFPGDSQRDEDPQQFLTPDLLERTWLDPGPKSRPRYALGERDLGKHLLQQTILCQPSTEMEAFGMSSRPATGTTGEACKDAQASFGS